LGSVVFILYPNFFKAIPIVSLTESNIIIFPLYLGFHNISQLSTGSLTIFLLYRIPNVPHIYGTLYSLVSSYIGFKKLLSIYFILGIFSKSIFCTRPSLIIFSTI